MSNHENKTKTETDLTVIVKLLVEKIEAIDKTINQLVDMLTERKTKTNFKIDILTEDIARRVHTQFDKPNEKHVKNVNKSLTTKEVIIAYKSF